MSAPLDGHQNFGPYCGCRYVGRTEGHGDVEVWLLYDGQPHDDHVSLVGVLYNRITAGGTGRQDHWIARPYGPAHQRNEVTGVDRDSAARALWSALGAAPTRAGTCSGGCL